MGIALRRLFRYHEILECQQARCCLQSFSMSKVHILLISPSTEESLPQMCTVGHFKAYAGPSRTKDRSCLLSVWICSMITHVHTCPGSHKRNLSNLSGSILIIHHGHDMLPRDFHVFGPPKKNINGSASTRTMNSRTL